MSSKDDLKKDFQQISTDLEKFEEYGKQLQMQIEALKSYLLDLSRSKTTLIGLEEEKKTDETLIQLGSGIMIRAKPIEQNKVLYNAGAGVIIIKTIKEAIKDVDNRIDEVEKEQNVYAEQLSQVINQINLLEQKAQVIYKQMQGTSKAQYDPKLVS